MTPTPCRICGQHAGCDCEQRGLPFALYDRNDTGLGQFSNLSLVVAFVDLAKALNIGPVRVFDRHGLPVSLIPKQNGK